MLVTGTYLFARNSGRIQGRITDQQTGKSIESANVILYSLPDSIEVTGSVSDHQGRFSITGISPGLYVLEIRYIGFESLMTTAFSVQEDQPVVDLGILQLTQTALESEEVVVEGQRPAIEYLADRKIIDVAQFRTAESGFAVDILAQIPSVEVDFDGNVSVRGSSNFVVQINGHPTVLDPQDALQQIPASSIKYIEIITNPSAKYGAEGSAGIINIILHENNLTGNTGMVHANAGLHDKYGGNGTYSYSRNQFTLKVGGNYHIRNFSGTQSRERTTTFNNLSSYLNSSGATNRGMEFSGINLGMDYRLTSDDLLSLGLRYGTREFFRTSDMDFTSWNDTSMITEYSDASESKNEQDDYSGMISWLHQFDRDGHELSVDLFYSAHDDNGTSNSRLTDSLGTVTEGKKTRQSGPGTRFRLRTDYTLPLADSKKIEAGYQVEGRESDRTTRQYAYDIASGAYTLQNQYSYGTISQRNEQSLYSIFSDTWNRFSYKVGARGEYTYRNISHPDTSAAFHLDRWEVFPSLHTSYSLNNEQQVMLSYSRRIDRPRDRDLEPFQIWEDAYNIRRGNPEMKPEYIDSWELGFQTPFWSNYLNIEMYYQFRSNVIEHISSVYSKDVTLRVPENVGTSRSMGGEVNYRFSPVSFWDVNISGNLRQYQIEGALNGRPFSRENMHWSARLGNTLQFGRAWQIHLNSRYRSGIITAQGSQQGNFTTDLAVRRNFFDNKLTATLNLRDLFTTTDRESLTETRNFTVKRSSTRESPVVMLSLRLNLGGFSSDEGPVRRGRHFDHHE